MISESKETLSSQALATSVGTNAAYIRKVTPYWKCWLIQSHQGKRNTNLVNRQRHHLLNIYFATQEVSHISYFLSLQIATLIVPLENISKGAVSPLFASAEAQLGKELLHQTLEEVINNLYKEAKQNETDFGMQISFKEYTCILIR